MPAPLSLFGGTQTQGSRESCRGSVGLNDSIPLGLLGPGLAGGRRTGAEGRR